MYNSEAGQKVTHSSRARCKDLTAVAANTEIHFNTFNDEYSFVVRTYDENKAFINSIGEKINGTKLLLADNIKYISNTIMRKGASGNLEEGQIILDKIKNGEIKPFICLSSETNKEFEEYGVKPSLYDTAEVECVGGEKAELELGTIASSTGTNNTSDRRVRTKDYIRVISNTECTVNADNVEEVVVFQYDENKTKILATSWLELPYSFILDKNTRYIRYAFRCSDDSVLTVDEVKDKSKWLSSIEISTSNKNLFNKDKYPLISDRAINANEGNTYASSSGNYCATNEYIPFSQFANKKIVCSSKSYTMCFYDKNKNYIDYISNSKTKNVPQSAYYMRFDTKKEYAENIQIELEEETSYTEHRGKTHIMPIQQKMFDGDTFEKIDGVWYEVHNKKEKIFNGNESITLQSINANGIANFFFGIALEGIDSKLFNTTECSHFTNSMDLIATVTEPNMLTQESGGLYFRVPSTLASTVAEFKEYLKNNNIQVVYPLAEPELILCTDEQSAILDKIDTYRDGTIITTDNDLCKISLRYKKDTDKEIKNLEQAIVALGGVI